MIILLVVLENIFGELPLLEQILIVDLAGSENICWSGAREVILPISQYFE